MLQAKQLCVLLLFSMTLACLGQSASPECSAPVPQTLVATQMSQDFILKKMGGQFIYGPWTFSVDAGVLKEDAHLRVEDKTGFNLGVKIPHHLKTEGGQIISVVYSHPASRVINPIRIIGLKPIQYASKKRIIATLNTTDLPVYDLTVMRSTTSQAEPDFSKIPTATTKSFVVEPGVQNLAIQDSGWLYVLKHDLEGGQQCLEEAVGEIAKNIGDKVAAYVNDPCKACQAVAELVVDFNKCQDLVNNLGPILCETFLSESDKESWTSTIINSGCKGATWLASWVVSYGIESYTSEDPAVSICNNAENLNKFLEQYKIRADCMCDLFIRDPRCKDVSKNKGCENIWNSVQT
jgi:hypothetical protein